jgi:UDP-3-O-[3-hydroxymyristoyl] glucosamine N-acyltransferase
VTITVRQLAEWVHGEVLGDADLPIANARTLAEAEPGDITFVEDEKHLTAWHASRASAAIVPTTVPVNGRPIIRVSDPLMAFVDVVQQLRGKVSLRPEGIDPSAHVHPTARLAEGVAVGPFVVVGAGSVIGSNTVLAAGVTIGRNCSLGADVVIHPRAVLYDDCRVGNRVVIHANAVIGADGFGYRMHNGKHVKVPQIGGVDIEDDVEIGACATIDRGTFTPTRIGTGTKIDNHVMIAHNCHIGRHNVIAAQVGVAGSSTTGDYVVMAGQVGIADHLSIGDRAVLAAQAGVTKDVPADMTVFGTPAIAMREHLRRFVCVAKLPEMVRDVQRVKKQLGIEDG